MIEILDDVGHGKWMVYQTLDESTQPEKQYSATYHGNNGKVIAKHWILFTDELQEYLPKWKQHRRT